MFFTIFNHLKNAKTHTADYYVQGITTGNRTVLAQAITLCESTLPEHRVLANEVLKLCLPHAGKSIRVGITGVPGVGKSTFIESLGMYLTGLNHRVAVLAVDPSSALTKGSILGDKTRMEELSINPLAFIRPSPSAGNLGGVANRTRETIILCEAAGYDVVLVETVGVGQSETDVKNMTDFFLLLMLAGAGDELQGIKRGIMEMADSIVINKADGDNFDKARVARADYARAAHMFPATESGWVTRIEVCSALEKKGIDTVWKIIEEHHNLLNSKGLIQETRQKQNLSWFRQMVDEGLLAHFSTHNKTLITETEHAVAAGLLLPTEAASTLLNKLLK